MISSHVKITCYFHMWKYHRCYGYIINCAFRRKRNCFSEMVWYFIGVYIINRTLHDRLEIRNFSSRREIAYLRPCNILYISTTLILIQSYTVHSDKQYFRCEFVQLRKTSDGQNSPCSCLDCCLWNFPLQLQSIPLTVATSLNIKWWSAEISSQLALW